MYKQREKIMPSGGQIVNDYQWYISVLLQHLSSAY
jgi:hypothetical protein